MDTRFNFLVVGVGGQGVLTASDIIAQVGLDLGLDAKKSEIHGFAQRGGVVESHVRWAPQVASPTNARGEVDVLLAFELLEAARWVDWLRPGGTIIVNRQRIIPMSVSVGQEVYPPEADLLAALKRRSGCLVTLDALKLAEEAGNARTVNTVMLAALAALLDTPREVWETAILRRVPARYGDVNRKAFALGWDAAQER